MSLRKNLNKYKNNWKILLKSKLKKEEEELRKEIKRKWTLKLWISSKLSPIYRVIIIFLIIMKVTWKSQFNMGNGDILNYLFIAFPFKCQSF